MDKPLGRKQSMDNSRWLAAMENIEKTITREDLDSLEAATIAEIRERTANRKAAYAWSAGKDSIVLGRLCEAAGVTDSMIGVCDLEYPAYYNIFGRKKLSSRKSFHHLVPKLQ